MRNRTLALFVTLVALVGIAFGATVSHYTIIHSIIDSTPIGNTTPAAGNFTTLSLNGTAPAGHQLCGDGSHYVDCTPFFSAGGDWYFSFTGCNLNVSGNSVNCQGSVNFSSVSPVVTTQGDANYYTTCNMLTGNNWGTSMNINSQSTTGFSFSENVDRYNGTSGNVTPTVWCHVHHN